MTLRFATPIPSNTINSSVVRRSAPRPPRLFIQPVDATRSRTITAPVSSRKALPRFASLSVKKYITRDRLRSLQYSSRTEHYSILYTASSAILQPAVAITRPSGLPNSNHGIHCKSNLRSVPHVSHRASYSTAHRAAPCRARHVQFVLHHHHYHHPCQRLDSTLRRGFMHPSCTFTA
jgi:hypothetical protein